MSWIQRAKVGDKIVCVKLDVDALEGVVLLEQPTDPEIGVVYTISKIIIGEIEKKVCIALKELPEQRISFVWNGVVCNGIVHFDPNCFRPVQPRDTDISVFTDMLDTAPAKVGERV